MLRRCGRGAPSQGLAMVPRHPLLWVALQLGMPLQLGQIVERIGFVQLAGVDQTHEQIADSGAIQRLVKERVPPVQNGFLQSTLNYVIAKYPRKMEEAIADLLSRPSIEDAARVIGVQPKTLRRWMREPEFQAAYLLARREAVSQAQARLQQGSAGRDRQNQTRCTDAARSAPA